MFVVKEGKEDQRKFGGKLLNTRYNSLRVNMSMDRDAWRSRNHVADLT